MASRPPSCPAHLLARTTPGARVSNIHILASGFSPRRNLRHHAVKRDRSGDRETELTQCSSAFSAPGVLFQSSPCCSFSTSSLVRACSLSHVRLFATPWTVARQPPLSMGFSRKEYWSGFPFLPPGDPPDSGTKPLSPALAGRFFFFFFRCAIREALFPG